MRGWWRTPRRVDRTAREVKRRLIPGSSADPRQHWKLGLVVLALVLASVHDFVLGRRAGRPGAAPSIRVRASWIARINVLVVLVIVLLGLGLLR